MESNIHNHVFITLYIPKIRIWLFFCFVVVVVVVVVLFFFNLKIILLCMKGQVLFLQKPRMDKSNTSPLCHFLHLCSYHTGRSRTCNLMTWYHKVLYAGALNAIISNLTTAQSECKPTARSPIGLWTILKPVWHNILHHLGFFFRPECRFLE